MWLKQEYSPATIAQTMMNLKEAGHSVTKITEQLTASRTSQALATAVQGGREL